MTQQLAPEMTEAEKVRGEALEALKAVLNNSRLSNDAKRGDIREIRAQADARLAELREQHLARQAARMRQLERAAFGLPEGTIDAISYRDAVARLDSLEDTAGSTAHEKAHVLAARAVRIDDAVMLRALALVATEKGWHAALNEVLTALPGASREAIEELNRARSNRLGNRLAVDFAFSPTTMPAD